MIEFLQQHWGYVLAASLIGLELVAFAAAVHALMNVRTAQGTIAWILALIALPPIALPLYATFGNRRFQGYILAKREGDQAIEALTGNDPLPGNLQQPSQSTGRLATFQSLTPVPVSSNNQVDLLIDGQQTFDAMFISIASARRYVLIQFYIVRDDELGRQLQQQLLDCAARGVRVYFLFDAVGSHRLSRSYVNTLREGGVAIESFTGTTRRVRRLQINFRNHRKIVVVDGHTAFIGGHNVGDEYVNRHPSLCPWRDTHVKVQGLAASATQIPFVQDWRWSTGDTIKVDWNPPSSSGHQLALPLPTGPADALDSCGLMFVHAINSATRRLWIVSPYFVPDGSVIDALKLAVLRGVDVRLLLPAKADSTLVQLAGHAYTPELIAAGIRVFRYEQGFLHQKVLLVDTDLSFVGTANMDNRSFRLNFEVTLLVADANFAREMETMLTVDFGQAREVDAAELAARPWWFRALTRGARLLSPVL